MDITIEIVERPLYLTIFVSLLATLLLWFMLQYLLRKKYIELKDLNLTSKLSLRIIIFGCVLAQSIYVILEILGYN